VKQNSNSKITGSIVMAVIDPIGDNPELATSLRLGGDDFTPPEPEETGPLYRVIGDNKIPVSKHVGKLWASRIEQSKTARSDAEDCWSEAILYYDNDQTSHRNASSGRSGGQRTVRGISETWSATENVVFSNATLMLPMLYAKNPSIEITAGYKAVEPFAVCCEHLINKLLNMKDAPGLNFKSKARRGVLAALLTNNAYIKIGFTDKEESSEQAIQELRELSTKLANAKDQKTLREVEGQIAALEGKISFLSPGGPTATLRSAFRVYADPTCLEPDYSDANWMAEYDYIQTSLLRAVYGIKDGEQYKSAYEPTHVLKVGTTPTDELDDATFTLFTKDATKGGRHYGYSNEKAYESAQYTKVWYIWDKTTRRVLLYSDGCWDWPLWVWDDPYKLFRFFPYYRLWIHETPEGSQPKGEVTYYLDQQDAINDIHSEVRRMRSWAKNNVYYNKNAVSQEDVEAVLKGNDGTARGIDVPEGQKLEDHIKSFAPPSLSHPELWSTDQLFQSINRITGINDAQRGAQFKTNTTNDAIDAYQKNVDIRVDEKVDAIEDWIGDICFGLIQILVQKYDQRQVAEIVGEEIAKGWQQIDVAKLRTTMSIQVVGGSTDKPTSKVKKKQALETCQVLGQVGNSVPGVGILMVQILERAFDEIVLTAEDWAMLRQTMMAQQQKAGAGPGGGDPAQAGQESQQPQQQVEAEPTPQQKEQIAQIIRALPPESKAKMDALIQQGVSPTEALKQVSETAQQQ
jgi:hypothetical protein